MAAAALLLVALPAAAQSAGSQAGTSATAAVQQAQPPAAQQEAPGAPAQSDRTAGTSMEASSAAPSAVPAPQYSSADLRRLMSENNTDIRKAKEEYDRSVLDVADARAGMGPKIDLQVSGIYMTNPPVGKITVDVDDIINAIQWPSGYKPNQTGQYITLYDGMENTFYNFQLTMQQPVFTWGKLANAVKLYEAVSRVKELQFVSKRKQLNTELETRLMSLWYLSQLSRILAEEKTYAERMVACSEDAEKAGMLLHQDVIEARIQAKELDIAAEDVAEQVKNQYLALQKLTGRDDLCADTVSYQFDENTVGAVMNMDRGSVELMALSQAQDSLKMLSLLKSVSDTAATIAKDSVYWKPDLGLEISMGYAGSRVPLFEENWLRKDDYSVNFSLGLKTTVWDGGRKMRDVTRRLSESATASISEDEARATIRQTLQEQWNTADVCAMRVEYQDLKIETAESKIKQQDAVFKSGYGSETDLLKAKIDWCNARIEKIKQQLSQAAACLTIQYLEGKDIQGPAE